MSSKVVAETARSLPGWPRAVWTALAWVVGLGACSSDFAPYSDLDRLRILAVQSEPATPLPGETAVLSVLAFAPAGEVPAFHWSWCPVVARADQTYACPLDQPEAERIFAPFLDPAGSQVLPSLDLGSAPMAALNNPFSLATLAGLCADGINSPGYSQSIDCEGGYPSMVTVDVTTASSTLRAGFVVRFPSSSPPVLNRNPSPSGLFVAGVPLDDAAAKVVVAPSQTVDMQAVFPSDAAELRPIPAAEGPPGQRLERLTASWFADRGRIDTDRTVFIDGTVSLDQAARNRWTAPAAEDWPSDNVVRFMVVLRDDRGGVGWIVRQALVEKAP